MAEQTATQESETKETMEYWGYLFKPDKCGTEKLNRLLAGIARYIATTFGQPTDSPDLTPSQLAAFYRAVGGNYDILFVDTPSNSIAFIYKSLGCLQSLQPNQTSKDAAYQVPTIPALKQKGFVTWQTIQLLLGPEEHVLFLQNALRQFEIRDPVDGTAFPKLLPKEAFPDKPDPDMLKWYEEVSEKLKKEAEAVQLASRANEAQADNVAPLPRLRSESESVDEKDHAARYFADPLYARERFGPERERLDRPGMVRRYSRQSPRSPSTREYVTEKGKDLVQSVRHLISPRTRRRSLPDRPSDDADYRDRRDEYRDDDLTPTRLHPNYVPPRRGSRQRSPSIDTLSTDEESPRRPSRSPRRRRRSEDITPEGGPGAPPVIRHRRSHDLPSSPNEYFPRYDGPRRHSEQPSGKEGFGPSKAPPFVQQVANLQGPGGPIPPGGAGGRPTIVDTPRGGRERPMSMYAANSAYSGRPTALRYAKRGSGDSGRDPLDRRDDRIYADERGRDPRDRIYPDVERVGPRPEFARSPRSNEGFGPGRRRRSHSEDPRSPFEEERERSKKLHRYVKPESGVSGRKYAVAEWR